MDYTKLVNKIHFWVSKKKPESEFLDKKPKLTKVVGYNDVLSFNEQSNHIFNQIKNQR